MTPWMKINVPEEDLPFLDRLGLEYVPLETDLKQIAELNQSNWIVVPIKENGKFQPDSRAFVHSQERVPYNEAVKKIEKELGFNIKISRDSLDREFSGNIDWFEAGMLNQALGVKTPYAKQEVDYLHLLYLGSQGKIKVFENLGKQIKKDLCKKLFEDKVKEQSPWRASWLDNDFKTNGKNLNVNYNHIFDREKNILYSKSEVLDGNTLRQRKQIDVLDYITANHTTQGLIHKNVKSGNFYSFPPRSDDNSSAGFDVDSGRADLSCNWDPSDRNGNLGVESVAD